MNILDVLLLAVALSMDAVAVSMTNGMTDSQMKGKKSLLLALLFGVFQALMPLIGYYVTEIVSSAEAVREAFEKASKSVAFVLLAFIGGKMIFDSIMEGKAAKAENNSERKKEKSFRIGSMIVQAFATSVDALAVGISLKITGVTPAIGWSAAIIGCITFVLSLIAVRLGRAIGNKLADKAEIFGGCVLILIGLKILLF